MPKEQAAVRTLQMPVGVPELLSYFYTYHYGYGLATWAELPPHQRRAQILSAVYALLSQEVVPPIDAVDRAKQALRSVQAVQYFNHLRIHEELSTQEVEFFDNGCTQLCATAMLVPDLAESVSDAEAIAESAWRLEVLAGDLKYVENVLLLEAQNDQAQERKLREEHEDSQREQDFQLEQEQRHLREDAADQLDQQREADAVYRDFISDFNTILKESEDWE